jgi:hypothetical protein
VVRSKRALASTVERSEPVALVPHEWLLGPQKMPAGILALALLSISLPFEITYADSEEEASPTYSGARLRHIYERSVRRSDLPLRAENLSDDEVREIQAVTFGIYPDAIANISEVTEGCPCEEGALCTSQIWVVANQNNQYRGLLLSRIDNKWTVGVIQRWWLEYRELRSRRRAGSRDEYRKLRDEQYRLEERFPVCASLD